MAYRNSRGTDKFSWASPLGTRDGTTIKDSKMVNCFIESTGEDGAAVVKRPGSAYVTTHLGTPQGQFYVPYSGGSVAGFYIVNDTIYDMQNGATAAAIPTNPTGVPYVSVVHTGSAGTVKVYLQNVGPKNSGPPGPGGGLWVFNGSTVTQVTDANYPVLSAILGLVELNGVLYVMDQSGTIHGSAINDGTTWPALDFVGTQNNVGYGVTISNHLNYLLAFYTRGLQLFYDANAAPNGQGIALSPVTNASWKTGCAAPLSVVEIEDMTFFVGQDPEFGRTIQVLQGLSLGKVSTPEVERILNLIPFNMINPNNTNSFTGLNIWASGVRTVGHSFYLLTSPDLNLTLAYDITAKEWQLWSSVVNGVEQYFVGRYYMNNSQGDYFQDVSTGKSFRLDPSLYVDATGNIPVTCVTPLYDWGTKKWKRFAAMYQDADTTSVSSSMQVSFTDNDYSTFSSPRSIDLSTSRKMLRNCGRSRQRAWKMTYTANQPLQLYDMDLDMAVLSQ